MEAVCGLLTNREFTWLLQATSFLSWGKNPEWIPKRAKGKIPAGADDVDLFSQIVVKSIGRCLIGCVLV